MAQLFVDISSHGLGHLAQVSPVLNALGLVRPTLQLTVRSGLDRQRLAERIHGPFEHIQSASDFGFVMSNALDVDLEASAARYQSFHANWPSRVQEEAALLARLAPDAVLSDVAYLPLAGAARVGIPALALCSLNWADLLLHYFRHDAWLAPIHKQILSAYRSAARFLRTTPGMPMLDLPNVVAIGPVASPRGLDRATLARRLGLPSERRWVLVTLGGFEFPLPIADWAQRSDLLWLSPEILSGSDLAFNDLLTNADALITKPGYGTFTEAAIHGVPLLYLRRPDWPEEAYLIDWLRHHDRAAEISRDQALRGDLLPALDGLWSLPKPPQPSASGIAQAVAALLDFLP
jgi:hypothetical protein